MSKEVPKSPYLAPGVMTPLQRLELAVSKEWGIPTEDLYLKVRDRDIVEPRQVVMHFRMEMWNEKPEEIVKGTVFNRTTVYNAKKTVENLYRTNKEFREKYYRIFNEMNKYDMDDLILFLECDAMASSLGYEVKTGYFGDVSLKGSVSIYENDSFLYGFESMKKLHEYLTSLPQFKNNSIK